MAKIIQVTIPSDQSKALLDELKITEGLLALRFHKNVSIVPAGDMITMEVLNSRANAIINLLKELGLTDQEMSITTAELSGRIGRVGDKLSRVDTGELLWEEIEMLVIKKSAIRANSILLMAASGILATLGVFSNSIHLVIAAMGINPGFLSLARVAIGFTGKAGHWQRGAIGFAAGFITLMFASALTSFILIGMGKSPMSSETTYLQAGGLINYWTSFNFIAYVVPVVGGIAGTLLVLSNRVVLTGMIMISLSLVPTATITGMALSVQNYTIAGKALSRFFIEALLIIVASYLVFVFKKILDKQK